MAPLSAASLARPHAAVAPRQDRITWRAKRAGRLWRFLFALGDLKRRSGFTLPLPLSYGIHTSVVAERARV